MVEENTRPGELQPEVAGDALAGAGPEGDQASTLVRIATKKKVSPPLADRPFLHVIITRLNTKHASGLNLQTEWLSERCFWFEELCVKSIAAQTCKEFCWIVFCDLATPAEFKSIIDRAVMSVDGIRCDVVYIGERFTAFHAAEYIALEMSMGDYPIPGHLLTTKLDSDDMLSVSFVETVQGTFNKQEAMLVNILNGGFVDVRGIGPFAPVSVTRGMNEFLTLIERIPVPFDRCRTVWDDSLYANKDEVAVYDVESEPQWIKTLHGSNCLNKKVIVGSDMMRSVTDRLFQNVVISSTSGQ